MNQEEVLEWRFLLPILLVNPVFANEEFDFKIVLNSRGFSITGNPKHVEKFVENLLWIEKELSLKKKIIIIRRREGITDYEVRSRYGIRVINAITWLLTRAQTDKKLYLVWVILHNYVKREKIKGKPPHYLTSIKDLPTKYCLSLDIISNDYYLRGHELSKALSDLKDLRCIEDKRETSMRIHFNIQNCLKVFLSYLKEIPSVLHVEIMRLICAQPVSFGPDIVRQINRQFGIKKSRVYKILQELEKEGYILRLNHIGIREKGIPPKIIIPACYVEFAEGCHILYQAKERKIFSQKISGKFKCFFGYSDIKSSVRENLKEFLQSWAKEKIDSISEEEIEKIINNVSHLALPCTFISSAMTILLNLLNIYKVFMENEATSIIISNGKKIAIKDVMNKLLVNILCNLKLKRKIKETLTKLLKILEKNS